MKALARDVVSRARQMPDKYRTFSASPVDARRVYGISEALLAVLLDLGLPCTGAAENVAFDPLDLENTAAALGLPSSQMVAMRRWTRSLAQAQTPERERCEMTVSLHCPEPGHEGGCDFSLSRHLASALGVSARSKNEQIVSRVVMATRIHDFDAPFDVVADEARRLVFHRIPDELAMDIGFLKETGLADCRSAARHLCQVAVQVGYVTRPAAGFFIGAPFPCTHAWFEIRIDDRWIAADPFFLNTLHHWNILDPEDWPVTRSPHSIVWPLEEAHELTMPLARHGNTPVKAVMTARWLRTKEISW
ncbi:transglutaminase domain-containing protein [Streptomyces sp. R28]|uniref:Transglutaminase domain-containing protein n=1 Tax=Streptomyces sp. R28 TaxID=3238628 RepID=A0AB39QFC4_9ACTN